jgi:hypothetical protein
MDPKKLMDIFQSECSYEKINEISDIKMRNRKNGIKLSDLFAYRFLYSKNGMTKERIVSLINNNGELNFSRQAFDSKENNIPVEIYDNLFNKIRTYYNSIYCNTCNFKLIGIDGTYNNDVSMKEMLNMGFYDISNGIPIDLESFGKENKNKEIASATDYIKRNIHIFKNSIIVGDRGYFSYDFINFLIVNNLKFIVRVKGTAKHLDQTIELKTNVIKYKTILNIRKNTKIVKYENTLDKTVYAGKGKKKIKDYKLKIKNDCILITNLLNENEYSDNRVLEMYKSRWDIEVFFKYIKSNFKFRHIKECTPDKYKKMYICELIIIYIAKIIEKYYNQKFPFKNKNGKKNITYSINKSNLINGIFDSLIGDILNNKLTDYSLDKFCKSYVKIVQNKNDRTFPRTSNTPFTKWYVKSYSNHTKYLKIIKCIMKNEIDKLNKNSKTIAMKIISINGKEYK